TGPLARLQPPTKPPPKRQARQQISVCARLRKRRSLTGCGPLATQDGQRGEGGSSTSPCATPNQNASETQPRAPQPVPCQVAPRTSAAHRRSNRSPASPRRGRVRLT
ncbi:hypothetical protein BC834DRAFT_867199, partial [Gloeopeniophorella convolvens]